MSFFSRSSAGGPCRPCRWPRLAAVALAAASLVLAACGNHKDDSTASQTAVRVNKEEVTVHQINLLLQQQRGLKPEQIDATTRRIVGFLVDQELAVQRARALNIDQDQGVLLEVDAAKREVLARAYAVRLGQSVGKPSAEEIKKYYDDHPALFKDRRIYTLQELDIEARAQHLPALRDELQGVKSVGDFVAYLKANKLRSNGSQSERAAEEIPADILDNLTRMKPGQLALMPSPAGALVLLLIGSRAEPLDETRARAAIEQFLLTDGRRKRIEADAQSMRAAAKIEYVGKFAGVAATVETPAETGPGALTVITLPALANASTTVAAGMSTDLVRNAMGMKE
jgi:EpsD family peptidyl-prolyl cis-trans isomerase